MFKNYLKPWKLLNPLYSHSIRQNMEKVWQFFVVLRGSWLELVSFHMAGGNNGSFSQPGTPPLSVGWRTCQGSTWRFLTSPLFRPLGSFFVRHDARHLVSPLVIHVQQCGCLDLKALEGRAIVIHTHVTPRKSQHHWPEITLLEPSVRSISTSTTMAPHGSFNPARFDTVNISN